MNGCSSSRHRMLLPRWLAKTHIRTVLRHIQTWRTWRRDDWTENLNCLALEWKNTRGIHQGYTIWYTAYTPKGPNILLAAKIPSFHRKYSSTKIHFLTGMILQVHQGYIRLRYCNFHFKLSSREWSHIPSWEKNTSSKVPEVDRTR